MTALMTASTKKRLFPMEINEKYQHPFFGKQPGFKYS